MPLGQWRVKSGIILRQAMMVNGTLYNSECWQGTDVEKEIKTLSKPDQALLWGLVSGHAKVPLEFLFLETGCVPLSYIHACRRLLYLQTILKKDPAELLSQVYFAQKADCLPGDYCRLEAADQDKFEINLTEDEVRNMSSRSYKKYIKEKVNKSAFKYLVSVQQSH